MSGTQRAVVGSVVERTTSWVPNRGDPEGMFTYIDLSAVDPDTKAVTAARRLPCSEAPSRARQIVRVGDVLVSTVRPNLNGVARVPAELDGATASTGFCVLRPRAGSLDGDYLFHWVKSPEFVDAMTRRATGASYPAISDRVVNESSLPLPSLAEQRRIATILDKADALRAKRRAAVAHLDALIQSVFLDMFGDPATNPRGWPITPMSSLFDTSPIFGSMIPASELIGSWLSMRVANIQDWQLDLSDSKYIELPMNMVTRHSLRNGDLLLARAIASQAHLGKAIVVYPHGQRWAFDSHLMRLRFNRAAAEPEFIRSLLRSDGGRRLFLKAARRSAVQFNINTKEIAALRIPIPPILRQREFTRRVGLAEKSKAMQLSALRALETLLACLQHRAFRGEL